MSEDQAQTIETVTIVGVGLIGGSFALALRQAGFRGRILGVSSPATLERALDLGVIDAGVGLEAGAEEADLVYLSAPIGKILEHMEVVARHVRAGAVVTDAGSTKSVIVQRAAQLFVDPQQFLGGHPMAGKESRGVGVASSDLFERRAYVLTPLLKNSTLSGTGRAFLGWLEKIGARVLFLDAEAHDRAVAFSSHLPQLASTALAAVVADAASHTEKPHPVEVAGSGLMDMTRLALSSYEVWRDILATNQVSIEAALDAYIGLLQQLRADLISSATSGVFDAGAASARAARQID
jgi:prephenate dehydrogenase